MDMMEISADGKDWKKVTLPSESFVATPDNEQVKTMTYHGMKHVLVADDGAIFVFDAHDCNMEVGKKYNIILPKPAE